MLNELRITSIIVKLKSVMFTSYINIIILMVIWLCGSWSINTHSMEGNWNFRGGGNLKRQFFFVTKYGAKLVIQEGMGLKEGGGGRVKAKTLLWGGMDFFWNNTLFILLSPLMPRPKCWVSVLRSAEVEFVWMLVSLGWNELSQRRYLYTCTRRHPAIVSFLLKIRQHIVDYTPHHYLDSQSSFNKHIC